MKIALTAVTLLTLLLLLSAAPARARQQTAPPAARLIDSFGEIQLSDLKARLDNFVVELRNDPSARGVVVAYGAKNKFPGWPLRRARISLTYMVSTRGLDASRVSHSWSGRR